MFPNPRDQWSTNWAVRISVPQENSITKYWKRSNVGPDMRIHLYNMKPNMTTICEEKKNKTTSWHSKLQICHILVLSLIFCIHET
jgi:hypothetical protein